MLLPVADMPRPSPVKNVAFQILSWIPDTHNPTTNPGQFNLSGSWDSDYGKMHYTGLILLFIWVLVSYDLSACLKEHVIFKSYILNATVYSERERVGLR